VVRIWRVARRGWGGVIGRKEKAQIGIFHGLSLPADPRLQSRAHVRIRDLPSKRSSIAPHFFSTTTHTEDVDLM
jgi:hypothetical protein